ncbi:MAG: hypothetical protein A2052_04170 [Deltaproteobacteria bacterium GWA2_54_12]|nr:MAG: hypothetical protein A2052_04170 [Deltaproteobacteria bacterium GWA2_54_12]
MIKTIFSISLVLLLSFGAWAALDRMAIDEFPAVHAGSFPPGWNKASFVFSRKKTEYAIAEEAGNGFLAARSSGSASCIYKEIAIDSKEFPILTWKWKVSRTIEKGDETTKAGDDYAARLYVSFEHRPERTSVLEALERSVVKRVYGKELPGEALVYVWANRLPRNKAVPNPDTSRAMMIAVESGPEKAGKWFLEGRNVYEDYKKYFGGEPPRISHIGIMTDTDNTGEEAEAFYDEIVFHRNAVGNFR